MAPTRREMQKRPPADKRGARLSRLTQKPDSEIRNLEGSRGKPDEEKWHP